MASMNPFDLLGDDENDDPSQLIAAQQQKIVSKKISAPVSSSAPAKLPAKPVPPAQAVREAKNEAMPGRGGRGAGRGAGRGGRGVGSNRDFGNNGNTYPNGFSGGTSAGEDDGKPSERGRGGYGGPRPSFRGGRRGGYGNGDAGDSDRPRRQFERRSGTGRGNEIKREGTGRGNWGAPTDDGFAHAVSDGIREFEELTNVEDKSPIPEKQPEQVDCPASEANKENPVNEVDQKEPEEKEMTLDEYEKLLEEKRKALLVMKTQERKVNLDKELESMQQLSLKKGNDDIFIKLGSDKDSLRRKENVERDERVKKSVSINEFLKPAEGDRYSSPVGRGRGRGRGDRGGFRGGFAVGNADVPAAPSIEDPGHFPTLGGK